MAEKRDVIGQALIDAKLSLDEAVKRIQAGGATAVAGQLDKVRAQDSLNTGCTNTGCGKPALADITEQIAGQK